MGLKGSGQKDDWKRVWGMQRAGREQVHEAASLHHLSRELLDTFSFWQTMTLRGAGPTYALSLGQHLED